MPKVRWVVSYGFVPNFICFPALQKFWKSLKIWQSYREFKGGNVFETQCSIMQLKAKVLWHSVWAMGSELIPVSWQSGHRWLSHKPGGRLPLLSTRPVVTFPAKEHQLRLAHTLMTAANVCGQLTQSCWYETGMAAFQIQDLVISHWTRPPRQLHAICLWCHIVRLNLTIHQSFGLLCTHITGQLSLLLSAGWETSNSLPSVGYWWNWFGRWYVC